MTAVRQVAQECQTDSSRSSAASCQSHVAWCADCDTRRHRQRATSFQQECLTWLGEIDIGIDSECLKGLQYKVCCRLVDDEIGKCIRRAGQCVASEDGIVVDEQEVEILGAGPSSSGSTISRKIGSSSQVPIVPCGALRSTDAVTPSVLPDVSTKPPLPPFAAGGRNRAIDLRVAARQHGDPSAVAVVVALAAISRPSPRDSLRGQRRGDPRAAIGACQRGADRHRTAAGRARSIDPSRRRRCDTPSVATSIAPPVVPGACQRRSAGRRR